MTAVHVLTMHQKRLAAQLRVPVGLLTGNAPSTSQWLKYKFGGPGTLKKIGALLQAEGAPLNVLVPVRTVLTPGNARQQL